MAKRSRGPSRPPSHRRPGTRPATGTRPRAEARPLSQLETAEIVAEDIIEDRPAAAATELEHNAARTYQRHRVKPGSLLAAKAATEYVYVAQDLRRIAIVAALLFGILFALWLLIVVLKVIPLPFY
jgi:hypothetical protein